MASLIGAFDQLDRLSVDAVGELVEIASGDVHAGHLVDPRPGQPVAHAERLLLELGQQDEGQERTDGAQIDQGTIRRTATGKTLPVLGELLNGGGGFSHRSGWDALPDLWAGAAAARSIGRETVQEGL